MQDYQIETKEVDVNTIKNAIRVTAEMIRSRVNGHIIQLLSESNPLQAQDVEKESDADQKSGEVE